MAREVRFRLATPREALQPVREEVDPNLRAILQQIRANPRAGTVDMDFSFDSFEELQNPNSGLNPIVSRIVDEINNQGFDPRVAGHGKGTFSLTW